MLHPFIAKKIFHLTQRALTVTDSLQKSGILKDANGGQLDAFRHAYWMALLVQKISPRKAMKIGKAHEKGNYLDWKKGKQEDNDRADSMACVMDLKNDSSGISIGKTFKTVPASKTLVQLVIDAIQNGNLVLLKKDAEGNYLDCNGNKINLTLYRNKWYVPKCLVNTSQK